MITKNPHQIAAAFDIKLRDAREMLRANPEYVPGWGRVELHPFIISRRHIKASKWPSEDYQRLHEHRKLHDEGKVNMCQGRDGEWIIQYALPNNPPVRRNAYFFAGDSY